ncbi:hypothetical protein DFH08DRAFT_706232 [Mycena albidolilacea]|uniref:N-acetyltransferase domain-containing protein n=1 Tax=Mycena albidolilacea TaxID=1033008 RepID=A0AAD6ZRX3_9AGAR|nr:hypothetical protein DFH08DRAFT_706232 [Mycena albidolilacea]
MTPLKGEHIWISEGLQDQDAHFETLSGLFEELGVSSFDIASQPECDLLSFAQTAFYFGVITDMSKYEEPVFEVPAPKQTQASSPPPAQVKAGSSTSSLSVDSDDTCSWYAHALQVISGARKPSGPGTLPPPVAPAALPSSHPASALPHQNNDILSTKIMPFTTWQANTPETTTRSNPTSRNIVAWEDSPAFRGALNNVPRRPIGIVYLAASPFVLAPPEQAGVGELNFGVVIESASRGKGYASEALQLVLKHAFDVARCHRVQASLLGSAAAREGMMRILTQMRFGHEGTKRRAFFHPLLREWQDVTTLALLDMDWALRASLSKFKAAPKSLWDELFLRHERERDELLRWEEGQGRAGAMGVKRSASVETLRAVPMALEPDSESDAGESDAGSAVSPAPSSVRSKGKKRMAPTDWVRDRRDPYDGASSDAESEFDGGARKRTVLDLDRSGASSPALSDISLQSVPSSVTSSSASAGARFPPSTPSASGSGSDWDLMESDSSSSFGDD